MNPTYQQRYLREDVKTKYLDTVLIKRLLEYLAPYWMWVCIAVGALLLSKSIEVWIPIQIGSLSQFILDHVQSYIDPENKPAFQEVLSKAFLILGWILLSYVLDVFNVLIKNWVGQKALFQLRTQVYHHIQHLPVSFFDRHPIGRLMTRTIHDVDQINQMFAEGVIPIMGSTFLFIGIIAAIFFLNWRLGLLMLTLLPMIWWFTHRFRYYQRRSFSTMRSILSAMNTFVQEHLMGVMIVRHFNLHRREQQAFEQINEDYFAVNVETVHHFSLFFAGIEFLQSLSLICVFVILFLFPSSDTGFQAGTYFAISLYGLMVFRPLFDLAERYNVLQSAMAAAERIFEILDTPLEPEGPQPGLPIEKIESIAFENVWFAYEGENWILKGISFTIHHGESIALVGLTGSGKTSVINLLLRFYEYQKGCIYLNGKDIRDYSVPRLRQLFSVILQDPVIFSGTVKDNIGLYDASLTNERIKLSADYVLLTPRIDHWPDHFETRLTERGGSLSVGEMQLLSLARAVAHGRSFLIFDEATANIDLQTEQLIQRALKKILTHQTAVVIAHRLSTIRDASRIIVLHQGQIKEIGTHQDLLAKQGLYEKLYRLQFLQ